MKKKVSLSFQYKHERKPSSVRFIELIPYGSPEFVLSKIESALRIMQETGDEILTISQDGWLR